MPIIYAQLYWYWYLKVKYWYLYWYLDHWYWYWYWYLFVEYLIQDCKLVLITNRKSYMSFRLVPKWMTLNDLERRNDRYIALFH